MSSLGDTPQSGILKVSYDESPLAAALKRKRQRLAETKGMDVEGGEKTTAKDDAEMSLFGGR